MGLEPEGATSLGLGTWGTCAMDVALARQLLSEGLVLESLDTEALGPWRARVEAGYSISCTLEPMVEKDTSWFPGNVR